MIPNVNDRSRNRELRLRGDPNKDASKVVRTKKSTELSRVT